MVISTMIWPLVEDSRGRILGTKGAVKVCFVRLDRENPEGPESPFLFMVKRKSAGFLLFLQLL